MKERPILFSGPMVRAILEGRKTQTRRMVESSWNTAYLEAHRDSTNWGKECKRYGDVGDRLWVRESFQPLLADDLGRYKADYKSGEGYRISYPATDGVKEFYDIGNDSAFCSRITPSIFMPRWASRITLEITEVRVQRLQEISEEDAKAEGFGSAFGPGCYSRAFDSYWDEINGAGAWSANPWVWAITFKVVQP